MRVRRGKVLPLQKACPGMRKRLQLALMATPAIATLFSFTPCVQAATNAPITPTTEDGGHKVYVNDVVALAPRQTFRSQQNRLVFWSTTERRWKSVPHANVQAAKSAAAEVGQYLGKSSSEQNSSSRSGFTQREIDSAIDKAAARHNVDPNLVRALVKVEPNFNPNAVSRKGATGRRQLTPQHAGHL